MRSQARCAAAAAVVVMTTIWLIGGTQESRILAERLVEAGVSATVTMATEAAQSLYPVTPCLTLHVGRLTVDTIPQFLQDHAITAILDSSHPFATQVSELAIATAQTHHLPYLRFERPLINSQDATRQSTPASPHIPISPIPLSPSSSSSPKSLTFTSIQALLDADILAGHRVLFTVGYRFLPLVQPWQEKATFFARILPSPEALAAALKAGFTGDRIIALRPPISAALERALWIQWTISTVVTKASGSAGGEDTKRRIADELGIRLITIARPQITYPAQTQDIDEAIAWCQNQ